MNSWKKIAERMTEDFMNWGCRFTRKQLPEIAMTYDCTPLFFWNWVNGETDRNEKGFLRVIGYAWKKYQEETGAVPAAGKTANDHPAEPAASLAA